MSSEPSSLADLRYTCPVCTDSLFPPVFQCCNGHLMCEGCSSRLEICGLCRATLPQVDWGRNLEVEKIIRMIQHPCPNETDGCQAKLKFDQLEAHRMECYYTKFRICELVLGRPDCEEIRICDFEEHLEKKHGGNSIKDTATLPVTKDFNAIINRNILRRTIWRVYFEEKPTLIVLTAERNANLLELKPWVLAERAVSNQLGCKISLVSGYDVKVTMDSPIFNLETTKEELLACVGIPWKYLQTYFPSIQVYENGKNCFRIELWKKNGTLLNDQASSAMDVSSST